MVREQRLLARNWIREREIERASVRPPFRGLRPEVDLAAAIGFDGRSYPVRIVNVSARGAMIHGLRLPHGGARIALRRGGFNRHGTVRWTRMMRAGVQFDEPFQREELDAFTLPLREDRRTGLLRQILGSRR